MPKIFGAFILIATGLIAPGVEAQRPVQEVLDLNRRAMAAYDQLDLEQAKRLLQQAEQVARRGAVTGNPLARTYVNLGVVAVGGEQDTASGIDHFVRAIEADQTIRLDPLISTPEIQQAFAAARTRARPTEPGPDNTNPDNTNPNNTTNPPNNASPVPGDLVHTPVVEQLADTPVPVYAEAPSGTNVERMYLFYQGVGRVDFERAEMQRIDNGFGFEIPCREVFQPRVVYYITALDADGSPAGYFGTRATPARVEIVTRLSGRPPALPGRPPSRTCSGHEEEVAGSLGLGDACASSSQCQRGLFCDRGFCASGSDSPRCDSSDECDSGMSCVDNACQPHDAGSGDVSDAPRFFADVGVSLGLAWVDSGTTADSLRPDGIPRTRLPTEAGYMPSAWVYCGGDVGPDRITVDATAPCQVRINSAGFAPTLAFRLSLGYYVTERIAIAASARIQFESGEGSLAMLFIGGRLQYLITEPSALGLNASVFAGGGGGQIQPRPAQTAVRGEDRTPFVVSGLAGVQVGANIGYRFVRNFGIRVTPELHFMFPSFLFNIDLTAGVELAF